jgi:single-strand DNA-binding protein
MSELRLADLNRVFMVGRLTKDPELRQTTNGTSVANFTIALNRRYKSATGEWKDEATYAGVVAWQKLAELCKQYLAKGRAVLVEGKLQNRNWETEDGQKRSTIEIRADRIEFLDREARTSFGTGAPGSETSPEPVHGEEPALSKSDDDLPF